MSNDGQDDKNEDNDEISTQLYSGAQVKNVINKIIGRINAFNPTEIQQLKSNAASISTEGVDPEIAKELKDLIASIIEKEKEEKNSLITNILSENQRITDEAAQVQAWKEEMLRFMETQAVYSSFDAISEEYLNQQQDRNAKLDKALDATKSGRELSKELRQQLKRTPKDIEEEKEKWAKVHNARVVAHNEHMHHSTEIDKIDQEISKVNHSTNYEKIIFLKNKKDFHIAQREAAKTKIKETAKHYDERKKEAIKIGQGLEFAKTQDIKSFWVNQAKVFENIHAMHPEKAKLSIEVSEKVDKIRSLSDINNQGMDSSDTKDKTKITNKAASKLQSQAKENGKTNKKTKQQWDI
ncbi:hypothetical protein [Rickettsia endosymbiont of Pantilius tunicatus]|uniref:hypothetical protein n=1 Tax=Rickettsia endosymbiont of Pantilius tunicatus TaxID=3066267 RepID=UPI0030E49523